MRSAFEIADTNGDGVLTYTEAIEVGTSHHTTSHHIMLLLLLLSDLSLSLFMDNDHFSDITIPT